MLHKYFWVFVANLTEFLKHFSGDISSSAEVECLMQQIKLAFNATPRGLVNCAGIIRDGWLVDMNEQQWDDVLRVNLKVPLTFWWTKLQFFLKSKHFTTIY